MLDIAVGTTPLPVRRVLPRSARAWPPLAGVAFAAAYVGLVTAVRYPLSTLDPGVSSSLLYVLGVFLVTARWRLSLGLVTALASVLALSFFYPAPPQPSSADDIAIGLLLVGSVVAGVVADRLRAEAQLGREAAERVRADALQASRARVIAAADAERRRVVRDLHDGAQQRLVHTIVTLQLAEGALADGDGTLAPLIAEALAQAQQAHVEVRELARGIMPPVLTRGGLAAGVRALAERSPVPVHVDVRVPRLDAALEATGYFIAAEALTNVAKHARARTARVTASVRGGTLHLAVTDDGIGGADPDGHGLVGLHDRVAALDGELTITGMPRGGTRIAVAIPIPRER